MMLAGELFDEIYRMMAGSELENGQTGEAGFEPGLYDELTKILKKHIRTDKEDRFRIGLYRRFNPSFDVYSRILRSQDFGDPRYIFQYGMYIGENEIRLMEYFGGCSENQLQKMADTYAEAFERGFERNGVDLAVKRTVNVGYHIGFEPVICRALDNFRRMGLEPLVYYDLKGTNRPRLINTKPSKQREYDHRFDDALYLDEGYVDDILQLAEKLLEEDKELIGAMAGPAIMEVFGEVPFAPESKESCIKYDEGMKALKNRYNNRYQQLFSRYLPRSKYSFTLISYPVPEIGDRFREIFDDTIKVNTLDESLYMDIQQKIIEALDKGTRVRVTGRNGNRTDLVIALNDDLDTSNQTNFNNCTADVNVPVGEVFTSPKLEGTHGKLHVSEVYLHGLKYVDLDIDFKDGMMDAFTCHNFEDEQENINYILENLTHPHKTLPLGEFAIGTNTTAYVMARKYGIESIIPILIGEKMGPHFAVGDTCYTWSEDVSVYNPDGREIVAKENSKSAKRKTNLEEAYTYCHTDITIPYSELGDITIISGNGEKQDIIRDGRFVLEGTQVLNDPLRISRCRKWKKTG